jgi:hypothetical protein
VVTWLVTPHGLVGLCILSSGCVQQGSTEYWYLSTNCTVTTLKNTTFQERGETTDQGNAVTSEEQQFSPLAAILENTHDAIPLGRYGVRHTSCGHNSK